MSTNPTDAPGPTLPDPTAKSAMAALSTRDAAEFIQHLSTLTRSGFPLPSGLRALAAEIPSRKLKATLLETAAHLESGLPLDESVRNRASAFPNYLQGIIRAGLRSGTLADLLAQYVRYRTLGDELRRRFWLTLAYPVILLGSVVALITFVMLSIVRSYQFVMRDFGISLPTVTMVLFRIADFIYEYGEILAVNLAIATVVSLAACRIFLSAADRRRMLMHIPLAGNVLRFSSLSEFCHLLGALIDARLPLPEALELASQGVNDPALTESGTRMKVELERGLPLTTALDHWRDCPPGLAEMFIWAEKHHNLAESLHLAGDMYEARSRSQAGFASVLIGTLSLILVVWGVGVTIAALYLPMINLISRLSG